MNSGSRAVLSAIRDGFYIDLEVSKLPYELDAKTSYCVIGVTLTDVVRTFMAEFDYEGECVYVCHSIASKDLTDLYLLLFAGCDDVWEFKKIEYENKELLDKYRCVSKL